MIALLLALAPVSSLHIDCPRRLDTCFKDGKPVADFAGFDNYDIYSLCLSNGGTYAQCRAEAKFVDDPVASCIWRADGTVEAKNATCRPNREGSR